MAENPTDPSEPILPPEFPDELAPKLDALDAAELRAVIAYAESLLPTKPAPAELIEAQPGEEIVEIHEHEGYTTVVKVQPCVDGCEECPHGPYLYRVRAEIHPDVAEPTLHWDFLGRVTPRE